MLRYAEFKYECGLIYLERYTNDRCAVEQLERCRIFWNWWKLEWARRERLWLSYAHTLDRPSALTKYFSINNPNALAHEITLDGKLLGDSYARMIAEAQKIPG